MANYTINGMERDSRRDILFCVFVSILCVALLFLPPLYKIDDRAEETVSAKAEVESVDNSEVMNFGIVNQGEQKLGLRIVSGSFKGKKIDGENQLLGDIQLDYLFQVGDVALISIMPEGEGIRWVEVVGPDRLKTELYLVVLFVVLLIAVAGWTGIKAVLSFFFSILMIWKILVPLCLKQYNPIITALLVITVLTAAVNFLIGGITKKGLIAFLGGLSGLLLTCFLAIVFSRGFHLNGAVRPFAKSILLRVSPELDITSIFVAGIFIACSGAVMDLAMDISASLCEIKKHRPDIAFSDLMLSGLRVGRSVIGTMTTTLLLAYSGGYTTLLMFFMAQGIGPAKMFNSSFLSAEILNTLVGSFGLVTVAPFTALVGSLILTSEKGEA